MVTNGDAPEHRPAERPLSTPGRSRSLIAYVALVVGALLLYHQGWRLLWFLTDDAYIAFRYVSNSQLGHGYVWNAPPFLPVEGYTSFLWVLLLDVIWSLLGVEPPVASNWLAFGFGAGTLVLTAVMTLRMGYGEALRPYRTWLLALVLVGLTTNFTFLMWSSSGLETALFNFLCLAWVAAALYLPPGSPSWIGGLAATSGLLALTRPDGLLMAAACVGLLVATFALRKRLPGGRELLAATPLLLPVVHVLWRRSFYGEWLPNTYYAKHLAAWPAAGLRYLLSYVLEYGLWFWAVLAVLTAVALLASGRWTARAREGEMVPTLLRALTALCVVATVTAHVAYYTLRVGGDHFEYRVYSHLVPMVLVSTVWMTDRLVAAWRVPASAALLIPAVAIALSWPLPWSVWARGREATSRQSSFNLTVPLADSFPPGTRWYVGPFDNLQRWLIEGGALGKRHQEHKVFHRFRLASFPRERQLGEEWSAENRTFTARAVGVAGWILARAHVIDVLGLNDYVIARSTLVGEGVRRMAHDRRPPPGYLDCYKPNVLLPRLRLQAMEMDRLATHETPRLNLRSRDAPLTAPAIASCERHWRERIEQAAP